MADADAGGAARDRARLQRAIAGARREGRVEARAWRAVASAAQGGSFHVDETDHVLRAAAAELGGGEELAVKVVRRAAHADEMGRARREDGRCEVAPAAGNVAGAFAMASGELESVAEQLRLRLRNLVEMDGSAARSFERFASRKRKVISPKRFARLAKQVLRARMPPMSPAEVRHGLMRFMDPSGLDFITLDMFARFVERPLPAVLHHGTWLSELCVEEAPQVVVDVLVLANEPSGMARRDLADEGYERALGADVGVWVLRKRASDFDSEEAFHRACVSDVACFWGAERGARYKDESMTRLGFSRAAVRGRGVIKRPRRLPAPEVWVQRRSTDPAPVFNLFFGRVWPAAGALEAPPTNDFFAARNRGVARNFALQQRPCVLYLRKLNSRKQSGLAALREEFEAFAHEMDATRKGQMAKQHDRLLRRKLGKLQTEVDEQLRKLFFEHMLSEHCFETEVLPDTADLVQSADANRMGWLTRKEVRALLREVELVFESKESRALLEKSFFHDSSGRAPVSAVARLLEINPARAQQMALCVLRGSPETLGALADALEEQPACPAKMFRARVQALFAGTPFEFRDWELDAFCRLFELSKGSGGKDVDTACFVKCVRHWQACYTAGAEQAGVETIQAVLVEAFAAAETAQEGFAKLFKRAASVSRVSLARLKTTLRKRTGVSDVHLERFLAGTGLLEESFVTAEALQAVVTRLLPAEQATAAPLADDESDVASMSSMSSSSESDDEEAGEEDLAARAMASAGSRDEWTAIRAALATCKPRVKAFLVQPGPDYVPAADFCAALRQAAAPLTRRNLEVLLAAARSSRRPLLVHRTRLLRALWPAEPTEPATAHHLDAALDAARATVVRAREGGVAEERICSDLLGACEDNIALCRLLRRLSSVARCLDPVDDAAPTEARLRERAGAGPSEPLQAVLRAFLFSGQGPAAPEAANALRELAARDGGKGWLRGDPLAHFKALDASGRGTLSRRDFGRALGATAPGLEARHVSALADSLITPEGRVRYDVEALTGLLAQRPVDEELGQAHCVFEKIRAAVRARVGLEQPWELLRKRDPEGRGTVTKEAFREVLFDCLGVGPALHEREVRLLMRWCAHAREPGRIDYGIFCRSAAPSRGEVRAIMERVADALQLFSAIAGGALDLRGAFAEHDLHGTGYLARQAFFSVLRATKLVPATVPEAQAQMLADYLDVDGQDRVDYVAFHALVLTYGEASHDERLRSLGELALRVRRVLLGARRSPLLAFEAYDSGSEGFISEASFCAACHDLYLPAAKDDLLALAAFLGHVSLDGRVAYAPFVRALVRAGGPGGILSNGGSDTFGMPAQRASDTAWAPSSVHAWLGDPAVAPARKARFVELYRSIQRALPAARAAAAATAAAAPAAAVSSSRPQPYASSGAWRCPACAFNNARIRFAPTCAMCDARNPLEPSSSSSPSS